MDWKVVLDFVRPELIVLIVFIWALGLFLKKAPWFKDEWKIPFILLVTSVVMTTLYLSVVLDEGFVGTVIVSAIIQGTIIAALAVFGYESIKQITVKRPIDQAK